MKAIEVLFVFLTALVTLDYKKAFDKSSKTWADGKNPKDLESLLPAGLEFFEIGAIRTMGKTRMTIEADLTAEGETETVSFDLVCESWPGKLDMYGDWGVDPESVKQVEYAKVVEEEKPVETPVKLAPAQVKKLKGLTAKAEDLGINIPKGVGIEGLEKLIAEAKEGGQ